MVKRIIMFLCLACFLLGMGYIVDLDNNFVPTSYSLSLRRVKMTSEIYGLLTGLNSGIEGEISAALVRIGGMTPDELEGIRPYVHLFTPMVKAKVNHPNLAIQADSISVAAKLATISSNEAIKEDLARSILRVPFSLPVDKVNPYACATQTLSQMLPWLSNMTLKLELGLELVNRSKSSNEPVATWALSGLANTADYFDAASRNSLIAALEVAREEASGDPNSAFNTPLSTEVPYSNIPFLFERALDALRSSVTRSGTPQ